MKRIKLFFIFAPLAIFAKSSFAQNTQGDWCAAHQMYEEALKKDANFAKNQNELERFTEHYVKAEEAKRASSVANKSNSVVRIIPVVVHVIHTNGAENISKAQILTQIDVLNKDFRRLNADTNLTPGPFKSIAADANIEFRMAQIDPNGNCTDGINRVYSQMTNQARDNVKALIYWPRNKYLNIWVVRTIKNVNGTPGNVIGFAQFPGGADSTDGVVIAYDWFGTIGTAASNNGLGKTTTHEVGHWLNLRHIWGDDAGACSGSDNVTDTPNQADKNFSTCPTFPTLDACTPGGNGILYPDYMDYTAGACQNIFTVGQANRMNAALASVNSGRSNLWSAGNLAATGVLDTASPCAANFSSNVVGNTICENSSINFIDNSYSGPITSRTWSFPGATLVSPSTVNDSIVTVQYPTAGFYDVSLTVRNGIDSVTITKLAYVHVVANIATYSNPTFTESFENAALPNSDWETPILDGRLPNWEQNTNVGFSGNASAYLQNFNADSADIDELISPTFNAVNIPNINFSFQVSFAKKTTTDSDVLVIWTSVDCGKNWAQRKSLNASTLAGSNPVQSTPFVPTTSSQWHKETVSVANLINKTNARIKFQFISGGGNNLYIDDINIVNPLGIDEEGTLGYGLSLYPNPSDKSSMLSLNLKEQNPVSIQLISVLGQEIETVYSGVAKPGNTQFEINKYGQLKSGIYFLKVNVNGQSSVKKLILN